MHTLKTHSYTPKIHIFFHTNALYRATKAIKWCFASGLIMARFVVFGSSLPSSTKRALQYQSQNFLDPLSAERERERGRAYGARETFAHNFDFLICTNSRVCVRYCYVT